jgi:hypothetical protein
MEAAAPLHAGLHAQDLARITAPPGPYLTLYLPTDPEIENAAQKSLAAWKSERRDLEEQGVPAEILDAIDPLVPDAHQKGRCLAALASQNAGLVHVEHGPLPPPMPRSSWAALPALAPIVEWRQMQAPYILVLTDRAGANIVAFQGEETVATRSAGVEEHILRKSAPGGWSQRRYQQHAENTWEDNAEDVAEEVARLAKQIDAVLVVGAGDVRALEMLEKALPKELDGIFHTIPGGRAAGTDKTEIEDEARQQVAMLIEQATGRVLDRFREEVGQRDLAVEGADATLEALSRAQIDTLLIYDHGEDDRTAWFGLEPIPIAATEARLAELNIEPRSEGRLIDVLVRAALGTGAGIRVVPAEAGIADNVGALLRWTS